MRAAFHPVSRPVTGMLAFLLCACGLPAHARGQVSFIQEQSRAAPQNGSYHLTGSVVNSATGEPIARAMVQISGAISQAVLTSPEGTFEFTNLPEGQVAVTVTKPGLFQPRGSEIAVETNGLRGTIAMPKLVQVGKDTPPLSLQLVPQAVIRGRVEAGGEPVESLQIRAYSSTIEEGRRHWAQQGVVNTDEEGRFRIANLRPGSYYLVAGPSINNANATGAFVPDDGFSATFYPGASDISGATAIGLAAGQDAEVLLPLSKSPLFHISGVVTGVPAGQSPSLEIADWTGQESAIESHFDASTGRFEVSVRGGSYTLEASAASSDASSLAAHADLNVTSDMAGIRLSLAPLATIPVHVRTEATSGSVRAISAIGPVRAPGRNSQAMFPSLGARLLSATGSRDYFATLDNGADGPVLSFREVPPGKYRVRIDGESSWYVHSALNGATDLLRDDLTVSGGGLLTPIEIVLRNDGGSISGTLTWDGRPAPGTILLVPDGAPHQIRIAAGGEDGKFEINSVAPGDYSVLAFDRIDSLEYDDSDVLSGYMSTASHITLSANASQSVNPSLVHLGN
jgi:Carboxypeptidase regulatory-like domain